MSRRMRLLLLVRYGPSRKLVKQMKIRGCWTDMKRAWRVVEARGRQTLFDMSRKCGVGGAETLCRVENNDWIMVCGL